MTEPALQQPVRKPSRLRTAWMAGGVAVFMVAAAFAAVPLYELFCRVTGFGGTTQVAAPGALGERTLTVRFDANVDPSLGWKFEPEVNSIRLRTGETATIFYKVTNKSNREAVGMATYNVAPDAFGPWFNKISCFCFTEQTLGPGESMEMPVVFFLDPALESAETMKRMESVTLSYTFMAVKAKTPVAAAGGRVQ